MAYAKYGTKSPEWWKHLPEFKRTFWKKVRRAKRKEVDQQLDDNQIDFASNREKCEDRSV